MIEQIINWWNILDSGSQIAWTIFIVMSIAVIPTICNSIIKNNRMTTTQKYREGLIKK